MPSSLKRTVRNDPTLAAQDQMRKLEAARDLLQKQIDSMKADGGSAMWATWQDVAENAKAAELAGQLVESMAD